ncbi:hypothetical protein BLA29_002402 [Euroglyphus maynei]|uniref:Uncharacterized protein n=1 Tax=Euroglyphus maynei TaxID=6958 RepID=A0A1Y3BJG6_EURMA|nr:hypothetical protein BLA29_002402 [Euroglyphus maynei]
MAFVPLVMIILTFIHHNYCTAINKTKNANDLRVLYLSKDSPINDSIPTNLNENFQDFSITFEKNQLERLHSPLFYDDNIKEESTVHSALAPKTNLIDKKSIVTVNNNRTYVPVDDGDDDHTVQPAPVFIPTAKSNEYQ